MRTCEPIYPPPGMNLEIPEWTPEIFFNKIGGGMNEHHDKFETIEEIFNSDYVIFL